MMQVVRSVLIASVLMAAYSGEARAFLWRSDWRVQESPSLPFSSGGTGQPVPTAATIADNGDLLIGGLAPTGVDFQFTRLTASGAIRWQVDLNGEYYFPSFGAGTLLPQSDGGAFVTSGSGTTIARIAASGEVSWIRHIDAWWLAAGTQLIANAGCSGVAALDAASGQFLWRFGYGNSYDDGYCQGGPRGRVAIDAQNNVYLTYPTSLPEGFRITKLNAAGIVVWDVACGQSGETLPGFIAVSDTRLYVQSSGALLALSTSTGTTMWSNPSAAIFALAGSSAEPIVNVAGSISRLAAGDGQPRWTQNVASAGTFNAVVGNSIVVLSVPQLFKLDADSGAVSWTTNLPTTDANNDSLEYLAIGPGVDGVVTALAKTFYAGTLALQQVDMSNGQLLGALAPGESEQGVIGGGTVSEDATHLVGTAVVQSQDGTRVHTRRLDATDGAVLWERVDADVGSPYSTWFAPDPLGLATAGSGIVVSATPGTGRTIDQGALWIEMLESETGARRWSKVIRSDVNQLATYASEPVTDSAGNIYIAYGTYTGCGQQPWTDVCQQQTLLKLDAATGATLWHYDSIGYSQSASAYLPSVYPLVFALAGSDIVLGGPFFGTLAGNDIVRLSGADGSVMWKSSLGGSGVFLLSPTSGGNVIANVSSGWVKIDVATGNALWSNPYPSPAPCSRGCNGYDGIGLQNGDILSVGEGDGVPTVSILPGNGAPYEYSKIEAPVPGLRSLLLRVVRDDAGQFWVNLLRESGLGVAFLAKLDPNTKQLSDMQALYGFESDSMSECIRANPLRAPENNHLLVDTRPVCVLAPATSGNALIDMTPVAHGDLAVQISISTPNVEDDADVGFDVVVTYSGDAPINGVHLFASLPWVSKATGLLCQTQAASNCSVDQRSDQISAAFDMQPGGRVDLSGRIRVTPGADREVPRAAVYGPTGLIEQVTINNFSLPVVAQSIFDSSFE